MWTTNGFEAETLKELKAKYVTFYADGFVSEKDVGYVVYQHEDGIETMFNDEQRIFFIEEIKEEIENNRDNDF